MKDLNKPMTIKEALKELKYYQRWRRGAEIPQPEPKKIGEALDIAINLMKQMK